MKGEKVLLKDLASRRTGKLYSMYVQAQEVEEYSYQNRFGEDVTGYRFRYSMTFPDRDEKDAGETMRPASGSAERAFSCNGCDPAEAARGGGSESGFEKSAARSDMTNTSAWEGEELPFR